MVKNVEVLKETLHRHMKYEEYKEVLETVAELVEANEVDAEAMYAASYSYFMTGDYTRAAAWLDHTLEVAPNHIEARILLARVCILEDKVDSGMAIFDFILRNYGDSLTDNQADEIYEIVDYYGRRDADKVKANFPYVAAYLKLAPAPTKATATVCESVTPSVTTAPQVTATAAASSTALDEMRNILAGSGRSIREKIRLLNMFAGGYFTNGDFKTTASFLNASLELDPGDQVTLRNLAILAHAMGRRDEAFAFAAKLPETDFGLLARLMQ